MSTRHAPPLLRDELEAFCAPGAGRGGGGSWALFSALKAHHGGQRWQRWAGLRERQPAVLAAACSELADVLSPLRAVPLLSDSGPASGSGAPARHLGARRHPDLRGPRQRRRLGQPERLTLISGGEPSAVAGVPPDYFSATEPRGQPVQRRARLGMSECGGSNGRPRRRHRPDRSLPRVCGLLGGARLRADGGQRPLGAGPGSGPLRPAQALGELRIVAEDLGVITPDVMEPRICPFPA